MSELKLSEEKRALAAASGSGELPRLRDTVYDWVRVIATLLVVVAHSGYIENYTRCGSVSYSLPENISPAYFSAVLVYFREVSAGIGSLVLCLFFALSGAVLAMKPPENFGAFIRKKTRRLIVPYYLCGLLYVIPVKFLAGYYDKANVLKAALYFCLGLEKAHLWFLPVLFICMALFALMYCFVLRDEKETGCLLLMIPALIIHILDRNGIIYVRFLSVIVSNFLWFVLGFAFELLRKRSLRWSRLQVFAAIAMLTLFEIISWRFKLDPGFYLRIMLQVALVFFIAQYCSLRFNTLSETKIWKLLMRDLFSIYLFHDPLEYLILKLFFAENTLSSAVSCWLFYVLRTVGTVMISVGIAELLRQMKRFVLQKPASFFD